MSDGDQDDDPRSAGRPIFVSYSRADQNIAQQLCEYLAGQGFTVWWDAMVEGGQRYAHIIEERLEEASAVIVLWSKSSVMSEWVLDEAGKGREKGTLLPVTIDGTEPPMGFRQHQVIDATGSHFTEGDRAMAQLRRALQARIDHRPLPAIEKDAGGVLDRRALLMGGGAVLLVGAGGAYLFRGELFGTGLADQSLAILPFENLSGSKEQAYFSSGLAEELRSILSRHPDILVAAQTSSDNVSSEGLGAQQIAGKLKVANILEGSVQRSSDVVRVAVRLIDGKSGFERWSESFDRPFADLFDLQRDIAGLVADMLAIELIEDSNTSAGGGTTNAAALDAYLRGAEYYRAAVDEESDRAALRHFDEAIALDPDYAAAHAGRSRALTVIGNSYSTGAELEALYAQSLRSARRATEIAPQFAPAHGALGFVLLNGMLDIPAAHQAYRRSFETGFGNADILSAFANFGARTGDFADAREAIGRAQRLDPLNSIIFRNAGLIEMNDGKFDAARTRLRQALALNENARGVHDLFGVMHYLEGDQEAARDSFNAEPGKLSRLRGLSILALKAGDSQLADSLRAQLVSEYGANSLYQQAQIAAQSDSPQTALGLLEQALEAGDSGLVQSHLDPLLDPLREEARFQALQQRLGFG